MTVEPKRVQLAVQYGPSTTLFEFLEADSDHVQAHITRTGGFYELPMLEHAACFIKPGDTVIDVGAHIGNHTLFFAKVCGARVLAIEPNPASFALLERHLELNALSGQVTARRAAAGWKESGGTVLAGDPTNSGRSTVSLDPAAGDVAVIPLDSLADGLRPAVIKIDVEGMELDVLRGAEKIIRDARPSVYVECFSHANLERVAAILLEWGFVLGPRFNATTTYCFVPAGAREVGQLSLQNAHYQMDSYSQYRTLARRLEEAVHGRTGSLEQISHSLAALRADLARAATIQDEQHRIGDEWQKQVQLKLDEIDDLTDTIHRVVLDSERARVEGRAADQRLENALKRMEAQLANVLTVQRDLVRENHGHPGLKLLPSGLRKKIVKLGRAPDRFFTDSRSPFVHTTMRHLYRGNVAEALISTLPPSSRRMLAKLERNPEAFFRDSRNPLLRALGPHAHGLLKERLARAARPAAPPPKPARTPKKREGMPPGTYEMPRWSFVLVCSSDADMVVCRSVAETLPNDAELLVVTCAEYWQGKAEDMLSLPGARFRVVLLERASRAAMLNLGMLHATGLTVVLTEGAVGRDALRSALRPLEKKQASLSSDGEHAVLLLAQTCVARLGYLVVDATRPFEEYVQRAVRAFGPSAVDVPGHLQALATGGGAEAAPERVFQPFVDEHATEPLSAALLEQSPAGDDFLVYRLPRPGVPFAQAVARPYAVCFQRRPSWMSVLRDLDEQDKPLISVVMTSYNAARTVEFAIDSILGQTYANLELIIVDDCSTDDSLRLSLRKAQSDARVKVLQSPQNSGTYWCKNYGIAHSKGNYITFHDSDDIAASTRLELQLAALVADEKAGASITCYQRFDVNSHLIWIGGQKDRAARISLMLERSEQMRAGYFDSVRVAADDEYLFRLKLSTRRGVVRLPYAQYWALLADSSLTTSGPAPIHYEDGNVTLSDTRREYWEAAKSWHRQLEHDKADPYLPFPLLRRPFPAPEALCPTRRTEPAGRVVATMATMPSRIAVLEKTVESLLPQVDRLYVYLNNFDAVPAFLHHRKIELARSQEHGDLKDHGKFFFLPQLGSCFHFTVDDDIIYPPDYVQKSLLALERYGRQVVVGVHGVNFAEPMVRFIKGRDVVHFKEALHRDEFVHLLGTGTVAYHTSLLPLKPADFGRPGMADLWFAIAARRRGVPLVVQARRRGWLTGLEVGEDRLFAAARRDDRFETQTAKKHGPWTRDLNRPEFVAIAEAAWQAHGPAGLSALSMDVATMARLTGHAPLLRAAVAIIGSRTEVEELGRQRPGGFVVTAVTSNPASLSKVAGEGDYLVLVRAGFALGREALRLIAEQLLIDSDAQLVVDAGGEPSLCAIAAVPAKFAQSVFERTPVSSLAEAVRRLQSAAPPGTVRVVQETLGNPEPRP